MNRNRIFMMTVVLLICVNVFCIAGTVMSQSKDNILKEEAYARSLEQAYKKELKQILSEQGCSDSGITMTRVVDEKGRREYTVTIHHKKIDRMSEGERRQLSSHLEKAVFPIENSQIFQEFLITEQ